MRQPLHMIGSAGGSRLSPERAAGIGVVILLHVFALWAVTSGLMMKFVKTLPPDIVVHFTPTVEKPLPAVPPRPPILATAPPVETLAPPDIRIERDAAPPITVATTPPNRIAPPAGIVADTAASGVTGTHTTPPYPMLARRLGEQGSVRLRLSISAQGVVSAADIEQTSGFADLDQAAVDWVLAHWKYKPAVRAGASVASTAEAVVVFNIKTAG